MLVANSDAARDQLLIPLEIDQTDVGAIAWRSNVDDVCCGA
jgi:hypothetical protein